MSVQLLRPAGSWDFRALDDLPDDGNRYEVVDGNLVVTPPPTDLHVLVANRLLRALQVDLPEEWELFIDAPVRFGRDGRIADLAAVRLDRVPTLAERVVITPAQFGLVVEVVSPSTRKTDRFTKPGEYAEAGIPLYWRVELDPAPRIHAFALRDGAYVEVDGPAPTPWGEFVVDWQALGIG